MKFKIQFGTWNVWDLKKKFYWKIDQNQLCLKIDLN